MAMRFNSLLQWLDWLEQPQKQHQKINLNLEHLTPIAHQLDVVNFSIPVVLVAGTNGKGTTVAALETIYQAAGYHTAAYTSPHFVRFNERLRINGDEINDTLWCEAFSEVDDVVNANIDAPVLSYFEFTVLAGLFLIKKMQHKLDVVFLEIGLGGRFDAMNVVVPSVSAITTIDLDHTEYLGDSRDKIAVEKAGVMRQGKVTVCGDLHPPESLYQAAKDYGATLLCVGRDFTYTTTASSWTWQNSDKVLADLPLAHVPIQNVATAIQVVFALSKQLPIGLNAIISAIPQIKLAGRMQTLSTNPEVIVDVAHNPQSARYLATHLPIVRKNTGRILAVVGMKADKDIQQTLQPMLPLVDKWYVADLQGCHTAKAKNISVFLKDQNITNCHSIVTAYQQAIIAAKKDDTIVVFGSFLSVGPVMEYYNEQITKSEIA